MKALIIAIITAVFPVEHYADAVGYCPCEWISVDKYGATWIATHHMQGSFYCDEEVAMFLSGKSIPYPPHVRRLRKFRYSWVDKDIIVWDNRPKDGNYDPECFNTSLPNLWGFPVPLPKNLEDPAF